ncbi:MAG: class I SAM-dependent methyltransferase [Oligoflexia bacterium]|nr:class I SAM-dependent methyltransferase [Oligoflexia bacterium]
MTKQPDHTAVRVALWRALHIQLDDRPYILNDDLALRLVNPEQGWQERPDMHPEGTKPYRASIVARSRFIEDYVEREYEKGIRQYVMLGSGLDTFAQRSELANKIEIFEIEKAETLDWKKKRLEELSYDFSSTLHFVAVDFEAKESWWKKLISSGFDPENPSIIASLGLSMYLTRETILETLQMMAKLKKGSTFIMTFLLPLEMVRSEDRLGYERSIKGAEKSGTPFISFFTPEEMLAMAKQAGFTNVEHTSTLAMEYFVNRKDALMPSSGEELLIARV